MSVSLIDGHIDREKQTMTDNEIIKALERCSDGTGKGIIKATLDLIKRKDEQIESLIAGQETLQKYIAEKDAEIEQYKARILNDIEYMEKIEVDNRKKQAEIERLKKGWKADVIETQNIKSEAVKECLEWVLSLFPEDKNFTTISRFTVNQKLKEMVGED